MLRFVSPACHVCVELICIIVVIVWLFGLDAFVCERVVC